ncbi:ABC transporter substrate-binding protein [Desulforudis sp. 1088]|uniref:ABC transporter substrate-binding protein n=1 Tax=Desulforudis sp. Tu-874 TaxID=3416276 RepID=UPI003BC3D19D
MVRKRILFVAAAALIALLVVTLLAGCGGDGGKEPKGEATKTVKLGGIIDLTGPTGDVGAPYADGVKAYIDYYNAKGLGPKIDYNCIDYAYQIPRAKEAYDKLVKQNQVIGILGWGTGDTDALKEFIARDKVPYVSGSYSESLTDISKCPYNFLIAASYSDQARIALKWAKDNWKGSEAPKVAFIFNDTAFGRSPIEDAKKYAQEIGFKVVGDEIIDLKALDATSQMLDLKNKGADFAIIQGTSNLAATTLKDAKKLGVKTQFIGLNWAADEKVIKLAGDAAEGYVGVIPFAFPYDDAAGLAEIKDYLEGQGKKMEDINQKFVQGWVSAKIMLEGVKRAGDNPTGESLKAALETLAAFDTQGLSAPVTFKADSHRGSEQVRLAKVEGGKFVYLTDWIGYK